MRTLVVYYFIVFYIGTVLIKTDILVEYMVKSRIVFWHYTVFLNFHIPDTVNYDISQALLSVQGRHVKLHLQLSKDILSPLKTN